MIPDNLINIGDLARLIEKIRQGEFYRILLKLMHYRETKITERSRTAADEPKSWLEIPAVSKRINYLISGNPDVDYYEYISRKYLANKGPLTALSLGCGGGYRELRWAEVANIKRMDAYDRSEARIMSAIDEAKRKGYGEILNFRVADVRRLDVLQNHYDLVLTQDSLHHLVPLQKILRDIHDFLKPDGLFVANEYVGPNRFQWTKKQLEAVNSVLAKLPVKYRVRLRSGTVKSRVYRPSRLSMLLSDRSEAAESSKIPMLIERIFNVVEIKKYGGTILHLLFQDIARNFLKDDEETRNFIRLCFKIEDELLENKEIQSDFMLALCRRRNH